MEGIMKERKFVYLAIFSMLMLLLISCASNKPAVNAVPTTEKLESEQMVVIDSLKREIQERSEKYQEELEKEKVLNSQLNSQLADLRCQLQESQDGIALLNADLKDLEAQADEGVRTKQDLKEGILALQRTYTQELKQLKNRNFNLESRVRKAEQIAQEKEQFAKKMIDLGKFLGVVVIMVLVIGIYGIISILP